MGSRAKEFHPNVSHRNQNFLLQLEDIRSAAKRIKPYIHQTPLLRSSTLASIFGAAEFYAKCENFQKVGAFKARGACNAVFSLNDEEVQHGVLAHSSGNHAQGVAYAARLRKVSAHIVMPEKSSKVKIAATRDYGATISFCGPTLESRTETISNIQKTTGAILIHPFNDSYVIAGQGTIGLELLEKGISFDLVVLPLGGGGLISGVSTVIKALSPSTRVIGVEPTGAADASLSFRNEKIVPVDSPHSIADGLLTTIGEKTHGIINRFVDDIVTVHDEQIIKAMKLVWQRMKIVIEPSAAVTVAAFLCGAISARDKKVAVVFSGGNADLDKLPWVS